MKTDKNEKWGDEAPGLKHYIIVFAVVALLFLFSWIAWHKWGWFH